MSKFKRALSEIYETNRSLVCVGLDPDPKLMPITDTGVLDTAEFCKAIVDATADLVCAYKPNLAFFEAQGIAGLRALEDALAHIRAVAPNVPIIGDAKRGDIASTNEMHAKALFDPDGWGFDAITVNGYMGGEALEPFFDYSDKCVFVCCHTSNPGSVEFQDIPVVIPRDRDALNGRQALPREMPLYEHLAMRARDWSAHDNLGLVVGATYPVQLRKVRKHCPGVPILIPGVGAQAGELDAAVQSGLDRPGGAPNIIINSSRSILYADKSLDRFQDEARAATERLRDASAAACERSTPAQRVGA